MIVKTLLQINGKVGARVKTSKSLLDKLNQHIPSDKIVEDIRDELEIILKHKVFSPDKSADSLSMVKLFLFAYRNSRNIDVEPYVRLQYAQKVGWENVLTLSGNYGAYDFFIENGYHYLS